MIRVLQYLCVRENFWKRAEIEKSESMNSVIFFSLCKKRFRISQKSVPFGGRTSEFIRR